MCKVLENRSQQDEERMDQLTNQLKEARLLAEDADGKSDEVSRKLAFVEDELEVAEDRVKSGEAKIMELEEELKVRPGPWSSFSSNWPKPLSPQVVGNSLKSLEVSEEKANQRVEEFKRQLKSLTLKLKEAENRAELAEKTVKKLQKEVDRLEGRFLGSIPTQCAHTLSVSSLLKHSEEKKKQKILSRQKQEKFLFTQCFVVSSAPSRLETIGSMSSCQAPRSMRTKNAFNCFFFYLLLINWDW